MASKRRKRDWIEQATGWFFLLLLLFLIGTVAVRIFVPLILGGEEWAERRSFEHRAVPVTGEIVGRFIETCAYGPCERFPDSAPQLVVRPDLASSRSFDEDFCIDREADGSHRLRGYMGPGPCRHVIVTAFRIDGARHFDYETVTPRYFWESWDRTSLTMLVDRANPRDARISDNRFDLKYLDLSLLLVPFLIALLAFEWIKARTWDPWRKRVKRRERDRERRRRDKLRREKAQDKAAVEA